MCDAEFETKRPTHQLYCGVNCRNQWYRLAKRKELWLCRMCGKVYKAEPESKKGYCSLKCQRKWHRLHVKWRKWRWSPEGIKEFATDCEVNGSEGGFRQRIGEINGGTK
jgi:hypothetical protein